MNTIVYIVMFWFVVVSCRPCQYMFAFILFMWYFSLNYSAPTPGAESLRVHESFLIQSSTVTPIQDGKSRMGRGRERSGECFLVEVGDGDGGGCGVGLGEGGGL